MEGRAAVRRVALAVATILTVLAVLPAEAARKALVIGNGAYKSQPLANPVNDASDMAARLKALGFDVVTATNATRGQMAVAILDFQKRLAAGDEAVVFYAGHGVQVGGVNYLMPVDAEPGSEAEVEFVAIDLDRVLRILNSTGTSANLLLLDACRNNPFEQKFRGGARGLARVESASGTLISYAAAPGTVAADGRGRNSPYTQAVLAALEEPGLTVEDVLKRVHVAVRQATGDRQTTWQEGQIVGRLVLNPEKPKPVAPPAPVAAPVPAFDPRLAEMKFWESVDRDGSVAGYEAYLAQYPDGTFAALARARVASRSAPPPAPAAPPAAPSRDVELRFWESAERGGGVADYEAYVAKYPDGAFAALARARIAALKAPPPAAQAPVAVAPAPVPAPAGPPVDERDEIRVVTAPANVRTTPSSTGDRLETLAAGTRVIVTGKARDSDWYRVERPGGGGGWVFATLLAEPPAPAASVAQAAANAVRGTEPAPAPVAPPSAATTAAEAALAARTPASHDGVWEGDSATGDLRLTIRRDGADLNAVLTFMRAKSSVTGFFIYERGSTMECDSVDISADGKFDAWCTRGSSRSRLVGQHPHYTLTSPLGSGSGPFVLVYRSTVGETPPAAAGERAAPVPEAPSPAASPLPAPAPQAAGPDRFRSPADGDGRWEGENADRSFRLIVTRSGARIKAHIVALQSVASVMRVMMPGDRIDCDDFDIRPDGGLRTWCRPDRTAIELSGRGAHYRVAGEAFSGGGVYELAYFAPGSTEPVSAAVAQAPVPAVPPDPGPTRTETRLAAAMPATTDGRWEGLSADGGFRLVLTRSGGRLEARIVVEQSRSASGTGDALARGDILPCDGVTMDAGGKIDGWCGEGRYSSRSRLRGAFPDLTVAGASALGGGRYAVRFVPSAAEAAQIDAEKRAAR